MSQLLFIFPFQPIIAQDVLQGKKYSIQAQIVEKDQVRPKTKPLGKVEKVRVKGNLITDSRFITQPFNTPTAKKASDFEPLIKRKLNHRAIALNWPVPTKAEKPIFRNYATKNISFLDTEQGLPSSYVWGIDKDHMGYLWLGMFGAGIARYDGKSFVSFSVENGLISDYVSCLMIDSKGNIWFGTDKGLQRFDGQEFYLYTEEEGLNSDVIWSLHEDRSGNIWIGTEKGVNRYSPDDQSLTIYSSENGLTSDYVWAIEEDHKDNIWIGTEMGITMIDPAGQPGDSSSEGSFITQYHPRTLFNAEEFWTIKEGPDSILWLGTNSYGLIKLDRQQSTITSFSAENGFPSDWIWNISSGINDDLWIGTYSNGIIRYFEDGEGQGFFQHFDDDEGLNYDFVTTSYVDEYGKVFIGTDGGGISILDESKGFSRYFNENMGMRHRNVEDTYTDSKGNQWLAAYNGLHHVAMHEDPEDDLVITIYDQNSGLLSDEIWSILEDSYGNYWFGSQHGLNRFTPSTGEILTYDATVGLVENSAVNLFEDSRQNLWIGSPENGLSRIDLSSGQISTFKEEAGLRGTEIMAMLEDYQGDLWIATYGNGLFRYMTSESGDQIIRYVMESESTDVSFNTLFMDNEGLLWIGTDGKGLLLLDPETSGEKLPVLRFTDDQGLSSNYIWAINSDGNRIWIGTENGINIFDPGDPNQDKLSKWRNPRVNSLSTQDGLKAADSYGQEVSIDQQGNFWWITGKGLVIIDPKKYSSRNIAPKIIMQGFSINNEFIDFRRSSDSTYLSEHPLNSFLSKNQFSTAAFQNYPLQLTLPHNINALNFRFSTLEWYAPGEVKYEYQVPGITKTWVETDENAVSLNNLDPGSYSFQVRALSLTDELLDSMSYDFKVAFPWWRMWWAYLIYSIVTVVAIAGLIRWRTSQIEKSRTKLRLLVGRKTEELRKSKLELEKSLEQVMATRNQLIQAEKMASLGMLSSGIAHELRNPINAVSNGSKILEQDFQDMLSLIDSYEQALESGSNAIAATREKVEYTQLVEDLKDHLKIIELGAKQTVDIVNSLNNYSRLDKEERVVGDIHQSLENTLVLLESRLKLSIQVEKEFDTSIPSFPCFYGQLNQLFMNLLANAIDAIEAKGDEGRIRIQTSQNGEFVRIDISDNGVGIDAETREKIFDAFYTSKEIGAGTGLGLWISQTIAQKHQGELTFESQPGKGSTFSVTLKMN